ncbi:hypothetical protein DZA01_30410 [Pseudomonas aeruginosa]|uniref:hypothetical protein n=1 Tax=Pseudomonas aeruginosa TaxID=287 RepID=UPI000F832BE3|nr:hypothetical protein [Pseudomonas aeruginosa]MBI7467840.1 hypothetical protein [Pseudomonas aeruginosa]RTW10148.1 hypothetical protein DZA01_30410 [Pseudomonas aeruginosa]
MKELTFEEVQMVAGAGVLAGEFSNAGLGFGSAIDSVLNGGTNSQIGSALGFGIGSLGDAALAAGNQIGQNHVNAAAQLGPSFIQAGGNAIGSILGSAITAVGNGIGGVIGGVIPG